MLLVAEPPTSKNLVKLEGIECSAIFTRGWCVAWSYVRDVVWICMELADHGFGEGDSGVG